MTPFIVLILHIFFLSNENYWGFLHSKGVSNTVVLFEMRRIV